MPADAEANDSQVSRGFVDQTGSCRKVNDQNTKQHNHTHPNNKSSSNMLTPELAYARSVRRALAQPASIMLYGWIPAYVLERFEPQLANKRYQAAKHYLTRELFVSQLLKAWVKAYDAFVRDRAIEGFASGSEVTVQASQWLMGMIGPKSNPAVLNEQIKAGAAHLGPVGAYVLRPELNADFYPRSPRIAPVPTATLSLSGSNISAQPFVPENAAEQQTMNRIPVPSLTSGLNERNLRNRQAPVDAPGVGYACPEPSGGRLTRPCSSAGIAPVYPVLGQPKNHIPGDEECRKKNELPKVATDNTPAVISDVPARAGINAPTGPRISQQDGFRRREIYQRHAHGRSSNSHHSFMCHRTQMNAPLAAENSTPIHGQRATVITPGTVSTITLPNSSQVSNSRFSGRIFPLWYRREHGLHVYPGEGEEDGMALSVPEDNTRTSQTQENGQPSRKGKKKWVKADLHM